MPSGFEDPSDVPSEVLGPDFDTDGPPDLMTDDEIARAAVLRERREVAQVRLNDLFGNVYPEPEPGIDCVDVEAAGTRFPYRLYMN